MLQLTKSCCCNILLAKAKYCSIIACIWLVNLSPVHIYFYVMLTKSYQQWLDSSVISLLIIFNLPFFSIIYMHIVMCVIFQRTIPNELICSYAQRQDYQN